MIAFFKKLPITSRLLLIGIISISFLIYFSFIIYNGKNQRIKLIGDYIDLIDHSTNLGELIHELENERKFSEQYSLNKTDFDTLIKYRRSTDSLIKLLEQSKDLMLVDFTQYTFLNQLTPTRAAIDSPGKISSDKIIQYYNDVIIRLNSLNTILPVNSTFLNPIYQDLISQKILSEMMTYLNYFRSTLFNLIPTQPITKEALQNLENHYKIFKSLEIELLIKASPAVLAQYQHDQNERSCKEMEAYLNDLFINQHFNPTYNANQWWELSTLCISHFKFQQSTLEQQIKSKILTVYNIENNSKNVLLFFLFLSIVFVAVIIAYTINSIVKLLRELKFAARKIAKGETDIELKEMPKGSIGNLAKSIMEIGDNNLLLAQAADEIGKGNFNINVTPRSDQDLLGISIKKMKMDLLALTSEKDKVQEQTLELVRKRDEFFSVASHELKTPITTLKAYTQLLLMDEAILQNDQYSMMLNKMESQINKLTALINDLLDTSRLESGQLIYNFQKFEFNSIIAEVLKEIQSTAPKTELQFAATLPVYFNGDSNRIKQVLRNLIHNALRFAGNSKKIIIHLDTDEDQITCSVQDFGNGIHPEEQQKIFNRYYRISGSNLNTYPGLGLGLYIAKEIIEKHGGTIGMKNSGESGNTFYFQLPYNTMDN